MRDILGKTRYIDLHSILLDSYQYHIPILNDERSLSLIKETNLHIHEDKVKRVDQVVEENG
jgi:hypothetical protein